MNKSLTKTDMPTQDEITKLAREYAEEIRKDILPFFPQPLPDSMEVLVQKDQKEAEQLIRFLLRTHCIVSKEKVNEAEGEVLSGWVAREESGDLFVYRAKPIRNIYTKRWEGERSDIDIYNNLLFPDLTWDSEPMEVEITIKPKKK